MRPGELNYPETADAARSVFEQRATHAFPPVFIMPGEWQPELETMAIELEFPIKAAAAIEQRFREIIDALGRAGMAREFVSSNHSRWTLSFGGGSTRIGKTRRPRCAHRGPAKAVRSGSPSLLTISPNTTAVQTPEFV
jgi:hypothetical protein